jgi:hypothetical protein
MHWRGVDDLIEARMHLRQGAGIAPWFPGDQAPHKEPGTVIHQLGMD